ncbi:MAG: NAD(P)H-hydrate dehydratase [Bacteroidales bacterium]|nr:NAD(P)H-hydrate dehydratase [Bacteroidales bacterium]
MRRISENSFEVDTIDLPDIFNHRVEETSKKDYGHALLIAGGLGKMGAAVLAARACLRSGVGLLTVHSPACGLEVLQAAVPEAMVSVDDDDEIVTSLPAHLERYTSIAVGPGIGTDRKTVRMVKRLVSAVAKINQSRSEKDRLTFVMDADALNIMAAHKNLLSSLPAESVLTPHAGEYQRLFGGTNAAQVARQYHVVLVQKSHHTRTYSPQGQEFVNMTGNAGMATAGSGDVLTGIILALTAQQISSAIAAMLGVYLHGRSGDLALQHQSQASIVASDIIEHLKEATL